MRSRSPTTGAPTPRARRSPGATASARSPPCCASASAIELSAVAEPVDDHLRPGPVVGAVGVVEGRIDLIARHRVRGRGLEYDVGLALERCVVLERVRRALGLGLRAAVLRRAGDDPAHAVAAVDVHELRGKRELVVLEVRLAPGATV